MTAVTFQILKLDPPNPRRVHFCAPGLSRTLCGRAPHGVGTSDKWQRVTCDRCHETRRRRVAPRVRP